MAEIIPIRRSQRIDLDGVQPPIKRKTLGFHCRRCGKGIADGISLFRVNPKGEPGVWACRAHYDAQPLDEVVSDIVSVIERDNRRE